MKRVIKLNNVGRQYTKNNEKVWGLHSINLSIYQGEIVSIIGPSGCGKTTLLKILGGILNLSKGNLYYEHGNIEKMRNDGLIGYVPQTPTLLPNRNVFDNVRLPLEIRGIKNEKIMKELLFFTGLDQFKHYFPHQLSGGMKQKVAIIRTLAYDPYILLMDEPFSSLDEIMREKLDLELLRIRDALNKTIVFVTHSIEEAVFLSDRVVVFSSAPGQIIDVIDISLYDKRTVYTKQTQIYIDHVNSVRKTLEFA